MKIKVLSVEFGDNEIVYFVDTGKTYEERSIVRNKKGIKTGRSFKKDKYESYSHFAGVLGKFDPYVFFFKKPQEVNENFNDIKNIKI